MQHDTDLSETMLHPSSGFVYCINPTDMVQSSFKTSVIIGNLTRRHIPEESQRLKALFIRHIRIILHIFRVSKIQSNPCTALDMP